MPYMSPEQIEGGEVDLRSDLFSLGIILYEMATRRRPFPGETYAAIRSSILRDDPPSVLEAQPDLPRHLGRVIHRCLEKEADRRYQSAREVTCELEIIQRDKPG